MQKRAFTLIELLIVVAIIAILAAIAVPNFLEAQVRAKVSRCKNDMRSIAVAIEAYSVDNNKYPYTYEPPAGQPLYLEARYALMTTPIAYITNVFQDPFGKGERGRPIKGTGAPATLQYWTYDFLCKDSLDNFWWFGAPGTPASILAANRYWKRVITAMEGNNTSTDAQLDAMGTAKLWYLAGTGPDRVVGLGLTQAKGFALPYDSTNGTTSVGDIVRLGP